MMNEKVSVIIPVYNVQDYIEECLRSIMQSSYENIEILAVNDGSKDDSRDVILRLQQEDDRIILLDKENGGLSDARNYGMKHSTGEYFVFIDGDDVIHREMIEKLLVSALENNADIAVSDMEYFYEDGTRKYSDGGKFSHTSCKLYPPLISINNSACNKLYKKELFDDICFPKGKYYEDLATIPILLYKASNVVKVNEAFYFYRQRKGSIAHTANKKIFEIYDALDDILHYVEAHGNEREIIDEIKHLYIVHGLQLTTLRIKDFDDKSVRKEYLKENMERLSTSYPKYWKDDKYVLASLKERIIYSLLRKGKFDTVLKIYDR